ncbi:hypothetical protein JCM5296_000750 [Sporobolomyces johnsonii]
MSFFVKVITGALVGGGVTLYYQDQIHSTTKKLSDDLHSLSEQLVKSAPPVSAPTPTPYGPAIPQRLPLSEEIKARWNEQVEASIRSLTTTNWSDVAARTWSSLRSAASNVSATASNPPSPGTEEVEKVAGVVGQRQV